MRRLLTFCIFSAFAFGEDASWETNLRNYFDSKPLDRDDLLQTLVSAPKVALDYAEFSKQKAGKQLLDNADRGRGGQNFSSTSAREGSTSLASLASAADSFGTAVENGGFTQGTSGTVTTFTVKPVAVYDVLSHRDLLPCHQFLVLVRKQDDCSKEQPFKGLSFSVSLDTSRDNTVASKPEEVINSLGKVLPVVATGSNVVRLITDPRSITGWGAKYEIYNARDPRNARYITAWHDGLNDKTVTTAGEDLAANLNLLLAVFDANHGEKPTADQQAYDEWRTTTRNRLQAAKSWDELSQIWQGQLDLWSNLGLVKANADLTKKLEASRDAFVKAENTALEKTLSKPIVSIEYSNSRPLNQPDLSNIKLLICKPFKVGKMLATGSPEGMFTFNTGIDLYDTIPTGATVGRLRDAQAALQLDVPAGNLGSKGALTFTLTAYYQYQIEKGLINIGSGNLAPNTSIELPSDAKTLLTPKGGMFIAEAKMTLKATDAKTSVPIGVSWSNRTELIKADHVFAGHIGLLFDWNSILPKNQY